MHGQCKMKIPGGEFAFVDLAKLRDYCLNPSHSEGKHKARVFASVLGLSAVDSDFLRDELLYAARVLEAEIRDTDKYGTAMCSTSQSQKVIVRPRCGALGLSV